MSTHFESIFDSYLDNYINKELNNLEEIFEKLSMELMKDISNAAVHGATTFTKEKERVIMSPQKNSGAANTIKRMFNDFIIESKKDIFAQNPTAV